MFFYERDDYKILGLNLIYGTNEPYSLVKAIIWGALMFGLTVLTFHGILQFINIQKNLDMSEILFVGWVLTSTLSLCFYLSVAFITLGHVNHLKIAPVFIVVVAISLSLMPIILVEVSQPRDRLDSIIKNSYWFICSALWILFCWLIVF